MLFFFAKKLSHLFTLNCRLNYVAFTQPLQAGGSLLQRAEGKIKCAKAAKLFPLLLGLLPLVVGWLVGLWSAQEQRNLSTSPSNGIGITIKCAQLTTLGVRFWWTYLFLGQLVPRLDDHLEPRVVVAFGRFHADQQIVQLGGGWFGRAGNGRRWRYPVAIECPTAWVLAGPGH